jgi:ammonium transporter, Amt family
MKLFFNALVLTLGLFAGPLLDPAFAAEPEVSAIAEAADEAAEEGAINAGDTAWMITASVLVLFMTLPGLALFYGGLVRAKNVLSILMQCFAIASIMSVLWVIYGYSVAFNTDGMEKGSRPIRFPAVFRKSFSSCSR